MYQQEDNKKYLNIREASVRYNVSRAKLNSLVSLGRLHTEPDPRDGRARLISSEELEELFGLTEVDTMYKSAYTTGRLTSSARGRLDALRRRVAMTGKRATDSVEILREMRAERSGSPYL
jgi:hypothetical protein